MPWIPFGTSTPSNSTLAISSNFLASSTRRNGDLSTAGRRIDDRMIPVCVYKSRMWWQGTCPNVGLVAGSMLVSVLVNELT